MDLTNFGGLTIRAYSASEAVPIKDAVVIIAGASEDNATIKYSLITNEDGITETVRLPAPPAANSLTPEGAFDNSSLYDVNVSAEGYLTKRFYNVPIFSGVDAVLPVNMLAIVSTDSGNLFPRGNINTVFETNEE